MTDFLYLVLHLAHKVTCCFQLFSSVLVSVLRTSINVLSNSKSRNYVTWIANLTKLFLSVQNFWLFFIIIWYTCIHNKLEIINSNEKKIIFLRWVLNPHHLKLHKFLMDLCLRSLELIQFYMLVHKIQRTFFNMYKIPNFWKIPRENSNFLHI